MISINVKLQSRSARDCFRVATTSLELARRAEEQWEIEHHSITGITFSAFSIEAMFNHFGRILFKDWNRLKENRKKSHQRLFQAVNLPNYLGSKPYQNAKKCFELRDMLAHGKTNDETLVIELPEESDKDFIFKHMMALNSKPFREASYDLLKLFVETARIIEKDIENIGFYPEKTHGKEKAKSKLSECPLGVSGIRSW